MKNIFNNAYDDLSVLVTGHTGFKGSWLSLWLTELGASVTGFSRDMPIEPRNFALSRVEEKITRHVRGDIRDKAAILDAMKKAQPEIVFHLAAQPLVLAAYKEPGETMDTNVGGTVNLLEAIRRTGSVRALVCVTTDKVYEETETPVGFRETDRLGGHDPYSASKAMVELAVNSYRLSWKEKGFSLRPVAMATARSGNVIGGGDFSPFRLIPDCFRSLLNDRPFVLNTPASVRPWQTVLDPLAGYMRLGSLLLDRGDEFAEAWNFGPPVEQNVTCEILTRRAFEYWGVESETRVAQSPVHQAETIWLNSDKSARRLDWHPVWTWEEALRETVTWFKEYKSRLQTEEKPDMHDICLAQIRDYVAAAVKKKAAWTP